jgi:hypothetical protein
MLASIGSPAASTISAEMIALAPERFVGLGCIPLQDSDAAIRDYLTDCFGEDVDPEELNQDIDEAIEAMEAGYDFALGHANHLESNANLDHEDAHGWYTSYGWHLPTEEQDIELQAVDFSDAESGIAHLDKHVAPWLMGEYGITYEEADILCEKAYEIADIALDLEKALERAVDAYLDGNLEGVCDALDDAYHIEREHGDWPTTKALANQLVDYDPE